MHEVVGCIYPSGTAVVRVGDLVCPRSRLGTVFLSLLSVCPLSAERRRVLLCCVVSCRVGGTRGTILTRVGGQGTAV